MDFGWIWKGVLIVLVGTFLLRFAGRKTIAQMTLAETVLMIAIGSLLVEPIANKNIWVAFGVGAVLVLTLILIELGQLKWDTLEKVFTGKSKVLISNGNIHEKTMAKMRMTVDQLEMTLRQKNVMKISDVEFATLEPNGQLGLSLMQDAQPVTKKEFQQLQQSLNSILSLETQMQQMNQQLEQLQKQVSEGNIFKEVELQGHKINPPKHLQ
jgi:uncharacterized membrane protein YcaP (DUF421 family)